MTGTEKDVLTDWMRGDGYDLFISLLQSEMKHDTAKLIRNNDEELRGAIKQTQKIIEIRERLKDSDIYS